MFNNYIITLYFLCDLRILSLHLNFEYNYYCLLNYNKNEQIKFLKYLFNKFMKFNLIFRFFQDLPYHDRSHECSS